MFVKILNRNKSAIGSIYGYDYTITKEINKLPSITFSAYKDSADDWRLIEAENYVETIDGRFTVKEISYDVDSITIYCAYDFEVFMYSKVVGQLVGNASFDRWVDSLFNVPEREEWTINFHLPSGVQPALMHIEWSSLDSVPTRYEALQILCDMFGGEFIVDNISNKIDLYESRHCGENRGAYLVDAVNIIDGTMEVSTDEVITWLYPYGKDGLTIDSITGVEWIVNKTYINKNIEGTWTDESYTDAQSLYDAAVAILNERCKPTINYNLTIADLYRITGNPFFRIELGDTIRLAINDIDSEQVVVKMVISEDDPDGTQIELAEVTASLLDRIASIERRSVSGSSGGGGSTSWDAITGKPSTFPPSSHTHILAQITDCETLSNTEIESLINGMA